MQPTQESTKTPPIGPPTIQIPEQLFSIIIFTALILFFILLILVCIQCIYLQKIKKVVFRHLVDRRWFSQSFSTFNGNAITTGPSTSQKIKKSRNVSHVYSEKNTSFSMKSMKSIFSADSFHASFLAEISKSKANKIMSNILCVSDPRISKKLETLENKSHGQLGENGQNASLMIKKNLVSSYQNKKKIKNQMRSKKKENTIENQKFLELPSIVEDVPDDETYHPRTSTQIVTTKFDNKSNKSVLQENKKKKTEKIQQFDQITDQKMKIDMQKNTNNSKFVVDDMPSIEISIDQHLSKSDNEIFRETAIDVPEIVIDSAPKDDHDISKSDGWLSKSSKFNKPKNSKTTKPFLNKTPSDILMIRELMEMHEAQKNIIDPVFSSSSCINGNNIADIDKVSGINRLSTLMSDSKDLDNLNHTRNNMCYVDENLVGQHRSYCVRQKSGNTNSNMNSNEEILNRSRSHENFGANMVERNKPFRYSSATFQPMMKTQYKQYHLEIKNHHHMTSQNPKIFKHATNINLTNKVRINNPRRKTQLPPPVNGSMRLLNTKSRLVSSKHLNTPLADSSSNCRNYVVSMPSFIPNRQQIQKINNLGNLQNLKSKRNSSPKEYYIPGITFPAKDLLNFNNNNKNNDQFYNNQIRRHSLDNNLSSVGQFSKKKVSLSEFWI